MAITSNLVKHCISTFIHLWDQKKLFHHIHTFFHQNLATSSTFFLYRNGKFPAKKDYFYVAKKRHLCENGAFYCHFASKKGLLNP